MPISYTIKLDGRLIHAVASGVVTDEELISIDTELINSGKPKPGMLSLADNRHIKDNSKITIEGLRALAKLESEHRELFAGIKRALVNLRSAEDKAQAFYAISIIADLPGKPKIFYDLDEACEWLGIDRKVL